MQESDGCFQVPVLGTCLPCRLALESFSEVEWYSRVDDRPYGMLRVGGRTWGGLRGKRVATVTKEAVEILIERISRNMLTVRAAVIRRAR